MSSFFDFIAAILIERQEQASEPLPLEAEDDVSYEPPEDETEATPDDPFDAQGEEEPDEQPEPDKEDTNRTDDVDEEQEFDEVQEFAEVDETDETSVLDDIEEEPQIYRAQFYAQEIMLPEPEDEYDPETVAFDADYDALDALDEVAEPLDDEPLVDFGDLALVVDDLINLEPDDMSDPLAAFRWFAGEDVFVEAGDDEWFAP